MTAIDGCIATACNRIAPTWPLDRFIAVNPYWGWRSVPAPEAAATLATLAGTSLTMPRSWFCEEWQAGRLRDEHLDAAAGALGEPLVAELARAQLHERADSTLEPLSRAALMTDVRDLGQEPRPGQCWADLVLRAGEGGCRAGAVRGCRAGARRFGDAAAADDLPSRV